MGHVQYSIVCQLAVENSDTVQLLTSPLAVGASMRLVMPSTVDGGVIFSCAGRLSSYGAYGGVSTRFTLIVYCYL